MASVPVAGPVAAFAEVAVATSPGGPAAVLGHGYVVGATGALDLDVRLGLGLTAAAPRAFGGLGLALGL